MLRAATRVAGRPATAIAERAISTLRVAFIAEFISGFDSPLSVYLSRSCLLCALAIAGFDRYLYLGYNTLFTRGAPFANLLPLPRLCFISLALRCLKRKRPPRPPLLRRPRRGSPQKILLWIWRSKTSKR